jgi:hypothetical protein
VHTPVGNKSIPDTLPIDAACRPTRLHIARFLIGKGADINAHSGSFKASVLAVTGFGSKSPPLVEAAIQGDVDVMDMLLDCGADATVTCGRPGHDGSALFFLVANRAYGYHEGCASVHVKLLDPMIEKVCVY